MHKNTNLANNKAKSFCEVVEILKTFITKMPDKAGQFLNAEQIIAENGGKIKRASYNKAIDAHTLFIDVSAEKENLDIIEENLYSSGYLSFGERGRIILIFLKILYADTEISEPLKIIEKYKMNISYINAGEITPETFGFKLGILIENIADTINFLNELSRLGDIRIIKNDITEKSLDNTVFYIGFAHDMRKILSLNQSDTNTIVINSNKIMQRLEETHENPLKTFEYIKKVAMFMESHKGKNFKAKIFSKKINGKVNIYIIEPPCGGNTFIIEAEKNLLFIDCGFACFEEEMIKIFNNIFDNFENREKALFLTHCDIDHAGLCHIFEKIFVSEKTYENFLLEEKGEKNFREQCEHHKAYHAITKIISKYKTPTTKNMIIQEKIDLNGIKLKIKEGSGGHIPGESLLLWEDEKIVFCGDIFVNAGGYSKEQAEFNSYAPYLTTSVNVDSKKALSFRNEFMNKYKGYLVCPGHGKWCTLE